MAIGFDLDREGLAKLFFDVAKKEVAKLCRADRSIDEHKAMDVATDRVLQLLDKVQGMRLAENYATVAIRSRLRNRLNEGVLRYQSSGDSIDADDRDYADIDADSDSARMELDELLATVTTEDERELLATGGEGLDNAEKCRLVRLRKRLKPLLLDDEYTPSSASPTTPCNS